MTAVATLLPAAALIRTVLTPNRPFWRAVFPFIVGVAGAYSVFALALLPWLGLFGAGATLLVWRTFSFKEALLRGGTALVVLVIVTLPTPFRPCTRARSRIA